MLASGADDDTVRIWSKEDKKVAPFDIPTLCLCHSASYIKDAATRREKENIGERHIGTHPIVLRSHSAITGAE